jgi:hypothetical protein
VGDQYCRIGAIEIDFSKDFCLPAPISGLHIAGRESCREFETDFSTYFLWARCTLVVSNCRPGSLDRIFSDKTSWRI